MQKQIWLTLIASSILAVGLPGRAPAQIAGAGPEAVGRGETNAEILARRYAQGPFPRLNFPRKPTSLANKGPQSNGGEVGPVEGVPANYDTFITFDAPGAGAGPFQGTYAFAINPEGAITGYYCDAITCHGFVRALDGIVTPFDAPDDVNGTFPTAINPQGAITGYYEDANFVGHAFLRQRDGYFTTFDAPGSQLAFTITVGINPEGTIAGNYLDATGFIHSFLRYRDGTIKTFDAPGAVATSTAGINPEGTITGSYSVASGPAHGFLRDREGTFKTFDVLNGGGPRGTFPAAINPKGEITGQYFQPISGNPFGGNYRGFLRTRDGTLTTFDAATYSPCCIWTFPTGINPEGAITGHDNDGFNRNHGFLRAGSGTITTFDVPGAGTGDFQGTVAYDINPAGTITGYYTDASNVNHGFLRKKDCEGDDQDKHCDADDHDDER